MVVGLVHGALIRLRSDDEAQAVIAVDGGDADFFPDDFNIRFGIDSTQLKHFEIGMQTRDAVGVDAAKVTSRQDVGGLFGIRLWDAEMHEHLSGKIPKVSIRKYL